VNVNRYFLLALVSMAVWVVLAFGMAIPSGFVHIFLAVGVVLIAVGIVQADAGRRRSRP
jgi:hypothetical protein